MSFKLTFAYLDEMRSRLPSAAKTLELLRALNSNTTQTQTDLLISELNELRFASNTNAVFFFYFPIVTHILYFKPECAKDILRYLIGPNFANGTMTTKEMIPVIQGAMKYKLSKNSNYLTKESQDWIMNTLPNLENEVELLIQKYWDEINE